MDEENAATAARTAVGRRLLQLLFRGVLGLSVLPLLDACRMATSKQRFAVAMTGPGTGHFDPSSLTVPRGATISMEEHEHSAPHCNV